MNTSASNCDEEKNTGREYGIQRHAGQPNLYYLESQQSSNFDFGFWIPVVRVHQLVQFSLDIWFDTNDIWGMPNS